MADAYATSTRLSAPPVSYVFTLRRNIALEGDLDLARMELEAFLPGSPGGIQPLDDVNDSLASLPSLSAADTPSPVSAYTRPRGQQGFAASGPLALLPALIRRLSFIQAISCIAGDTPANRALLAGLPGALGPVVEVIARDGWLIIHAVPHYALIELSDVAARHAGDVGAVRRDLTALLDALMGRTDDSHALRLAHQALSAASTTSHLSHDVHYYKAKFFPRMARAMLNVCAQRLGDGPHRALDNFAGSGTALLEAALLDIPSVGLDIDPLSAMIARAKLEAVSLDSGLLAEEAARISHNLRILSSGQRSLFDNDGPPVAAEGITFPAWLLKNRNMTPAIAE